MDWQRTKDQKTTTEFLEMLESKPTIEALVSLVYHDAGWIPVLLEIMNHEKGSTKFVCDKVIRKISENDPQYVYAYFDEIVALLDSPNNFIKWGAIITLSNLVAVDNAHKFPPVYEKYFDMIQCDSMITAANVVGNAWKIVEKYPEYEKDITKRLLKVKENHYLQKGEPSPECQRILCGHVLDCFEKYYETSSMKPEMIDFAKSLIDCSRKAVAQKALDFLKK